MRRCCLCCLLALLLSACNLDSAPKLPPTQPAPNVSPTAPAETSAPPTHDATTISPTRTHFGSSLPTPLPILASAQAPTTASGARAAFSSPITGALVGSPIVISGVVSGLGSGQFTLVLLDETGSELVRQTLTVQAAVGVRDIPFGAALSPGRYTGNAELRLVADTNNTEITLASVAVVIVPSSGGSGTSAGGTSYGGFTTPTSGSFVTGDPILISGTAGGFPETTFTLALITPNGTVINQQPISLTGQEAAPVTWTAAIGTGGYRGQVEVRAFLSRAGAPVLIASMNITLG